MRRSSRRGKRPPLRRCHEMGGLTTAWNAGSGTPALSTGPSRPQGQGVTCNVVGRAIVAGSRAISLGTVPGGVKPSARAGGYMQRSGACHSCGQPGHFSRNCTWRGGGFS
mmetsp:Transcript_61719/g.195252  ORF Transcript_61719/g.195252 Transcript_61719/m.195252 type:complete len:110 (+) Transcript_61719:333-662(+)